MRNILVAIVSVQLLSPRRRPLRSAAASYVGHTGIWDRRMRVHKKTGAGDTDNQAAGGRGNCDKTRLHHQHSCCWKSAFLSQPIVDAEPVECAPFTVPSKSEGPCGPLEAEEPIYSSPGDIKA